jgi:hypothetical protein
MERADQLELGPAAVAATAGSSAGSCAASTTIAAVGSVRTLAKGGFLAAHDGCR